MKLFGVGLGPPDVGSEGDELRQSRKGHRKVMGSTPMRRELIPQPCPPLPIAPLTPTCYKQ